jgi:hypothetical protein
VLDRWHLDLAVVSHLLGGGGRCSSIEHESILVGCRLGWFFVEGIFARPSPRRRATTRWDGVAVVIVGGSSEGNLLSLTLVCLGGGNGRNASTTRHVGRGGGSKDSLVVRARTSNANKEDKGGNGREITWKGE